MAEIHVLEGAYRPARESVMQQYIFHFPVSASVIVANAACNPTLASFVSAVPGIEASELAAIQAGEIVEYRETMTYHTQSTAIQVRDEVRERYMNKRSKVDTHYSYQYDYYLATITAS